MRISSKVDCDVEMWRGRTEKYLCKVGCGCACSSVRSRRKGMPINCWRLLDWWPAEMFILDTMWRDKPSWQHFSRLAHVKLRLGYQALVCFPRDCHHPTRDLRNAKKHWNMNKSKIEQRNELVHFVFTKLPPLKKVHMYVRGEKSLKMPKFQILDLNSIQLNMSEFEEKSFP